MNLILAFHFKDVVCFLLGKTVKRKPLFSFLRCYEKYYHAMMRIRYGVDFLDHEEKECKDRSTLDTSKID